jgi:cyclopropane-fatty-acyl-phospholipid synthase
MHRGIYVLFRFHFCVLNGGFRGGLLVFFPVKTGEIMLFQYLLKHLVHEGTRGGELRLITADGKETVFGRGTPQVAVRLHRKSLEWILGLMPNVKIGEAYMDGTLTIERGSLADFLAILLSNYEAVQQRPFFRFLDWLNGRAFWPRQWNPPRRARKNVAHHYDLPDDLYSLFLDADRQYSCGYFTDPDNSLAQAQQDKKRHIAAKLLLDRPGLKMLDIGSGWGGLALYLAREGNCRVHGVTLSTRQYQISRQRAQAAGLAKVCRFDLRDYRQETGPYDRIVSVGMFEHVGKKNYDEFFTRFRDLLAEDGVGLLHSIIRLDTPRPINAFIRKYIFPGADIPALSEIMAPIERSGLYVTDVEILRLHYAETLKRWAQRFKARRQEAVARHGEAFFRMWEFYLVSCEMGFRYGRLAVAQIQLSKRLETVPWTRDYMAEAENRAQKALLPQKNLGVF